MYDVRLHQQHSAQHCQIAKVVFRMAIYQMRVEGTNIQSSTICIAVSWQIIIILAALRSCVHRIPIFVVSMIFRRYFMLM